MLFYILYIVYCLCLDNQQSTLIAISNDIADLRSYSQRTIFLVTLKDGVHSNCFNLPKVRILDCFLLREFFTTHNYFLCLHRQVSIRHSLECHVALVMSYSSAEPASNPLKISVNNPLFKNITNPLFGI